MKKLMHIYENCKVALKITYLSFFLIALGFLIQNANVNIFYTFQNPIILTLAEWAVRLGTAVISNLPLIFMVNFVCKKANSGVPIILALVGYYTFLVTISIFGKQTLPAQCYNKIFSSTIAANSYPFETGMIGAFIVAYTTRFSYVHSRNRNNYSFLGFLNKDTAAIIYNVVYCFVLGIAVAYAYPFAYEFLNAGLEAIAKNLSDPRRIALYGFLDRFMSILGLGQLVRYPFWFTSMGGSFSSSLTGQLIVGDVNIWDFIIDASSTFSGCGRFITPYYIINMFIVPAIYLGIFLNMTDKKEKGAAILPMIGIMLISFVAGNPLPLELTLLLTAPGMLVLYLLLVVGLFGYLAYAGVFLGFSQTGTNVLTAMPGAFPDYIINLRNARLTNTLSQMLIVGLVCAVVAIALTFIYYRFLSYDVGKTGDLEFLTKEIINAVGGKDNIITATNSVLKVNVELKDGELISIPMIQNIKAKRILETKNGVGFEIGTSSYIVAREIRKSIK